MDHKVLHWHQQGKAVFSCPTSSGWRRDGFMLGDLVQLLALFFHRSTMQVRPISFSKGLCFGSTPHESSLANHHREISRVPRTFPSPEQEREPLTLDISTAETDELHFGCPAQPPDILLLCSPLEGVFFSMTFKSFDLRFPTPVTLPQQELTPAPWLHLRPFSPYPTPDPQSPRLPILLPIWPHTAETSP